MIPILETDNEYTKKWKAYAIWDENNIKGFFGDYRFLSNFQPCEVFFEGEKYPSSEHAFMASKSLIKNVRNQFSSNPLNDKLLTCREAKQLGKEIVLRPDWDNIRYDMMLAVVFDKFWRNYDLREKLLQTGNKYLEETCHWMDLFWGVDYKTGNGENNLGKILMKVRTILKKD